MYAVAPVVAALLAAVVDAVVAAELVVDVAVVAADIGTELVDGVVNQKDSMQLPILSALLMFCMISS